VIVKGDNGALMQREAATSPIKVGIERVQRLGLNRRSLGEKQPLQEPVLYPQAPADAYLLEPGTLLLALPERGP
jgi:hypothetical protein